MRDGAWIPVESGTIDGDSSSSCSSSGWLEAGDVLAAIRQAEAEGALEGDGVHEVLDRWSVDRARFEVSLALLESGKVSAS